MYRRIREQAELCREDVLALVDRLVRTPSFSFHEAALAEIVQDFLDDLGYDLVFQDEVGNVVGLLAGEEEGPTVLLNSHMDTRRPAEGPDAYDPPVPRVERGRVWGAGAADCKGGLASQIFAGHILDRNLPPLHGTLVVAATVAQEEGNGAGVRHLIEHTLPKLGIMPDLALLGEPTGLLIYNGHDGRADIDVRVTGGENAAVRQAIELILRTLWSGGGGMAWKTGGSSLEVTEPVCDYEGDSHEGSFCVRCRVKPTEAVANCVGTVKRAVLGALATLKDVSADVRVHSERRRFYTGESTEVLCWNNPWLSDSSNPLILRAVETLAAAGWSDVNLRTWGLKSLRLSTAGSLLADGYRIPTLCFGPGDESGVGTAHESVDLKALIDALYGTVVLVHGAIGTAFSLVWPTDSPPRERVSPRLSRSGK
jgi:acetylornithine deacetylase/succinyl-diaminopimelate desuccinylase-like protein